jgi:hypothetical protein
MTTLTTTPAGVAVPVSHDFPFLTWSGCGFPILPWDLAGDGYEHWQASTCDPLDEVVSAEAAARGRWPG